MTLSRAKIKAAVAANDEKCRQAPPVVAAAPAAESPAKAQAEPAPEVTRAPAKKSTAKKKTSTPSS